MKMFEEQKLNALYECAPIQITDSGAIYIDIDDLLNCRKFYTLLEAMLDIPCHV